MYWPVVLIFVVAIIIVLVFFPKPKWVIDLTFSDNTGGSQSATVVVRKRSPESALLLTRSRFMREGCRITSASVYGPKDTLRQLCLLNWKA